MPRINKNSVSKELPPEDEPPFLAPPPSSVYYSENRAAEVMSDYYDREALDYLETLKK